MVAGFAMCIGNAIAQEEEPIDDGLLGQDIFGWIGLVPKKRPTIEYRERAPLVVPPGLAKGKLVTPVNRDDIKNKVANWPVDPDVAAREKARRDALLPYNRTEEYEWQKGRPISPDKLRTTKTRIRHGNDGSPNVTLPDGSRNANLVDPRTLRAGAKTMENPLEEPVRQALDEPPTGYRKPSGVLKEKPKFWKPNTMDEGNPYYFIQEQNR